MEKTINTVDSPLIEYVDGKYLVRWNGQQDQKAKGVMSFDEISFPYKPSLDVIKDIILDIENAAIDKKILSGFVWNDMTVWLSSENQFNYKAAYDLATQTNGANLPLTFKFGDTENPKYHEFKTLDDLSDFYIKAMSYINTTLSEGWKKKDSIDWDLYQKALDSV